MTLAVWAIALSRIAETLQKLPNARDGVRLARTTPPTAPIRVVVPAHNEEHEVAGLVESLKAQDHPDLRVTLALDRCTDDTAARARDAIAGDPRFEIVEIDRCPDDWAGKVHAAWTGVTASSFGDATDGHLVFTDADCRFDPACLSATTALLTDRGLDFLSLHSEQSSQDWFERVAQPVACMELLRQYPLLRANRHDANARPFANGQFMLFRADAYHAIGGHESVKDFLLEDIAFARRVRTEGYKGGLLASDGMLRCRMYDSWAAFRTGWKRIYTESANRRSDRLFTASRRLRFATSILPALTLAGLAAWYPLWHHADPWKQLATLAVHALAVIAWAVANAAFARAGRIPIRDLPTWPVGAWLVSNILAEAARDLRAGAPTRWGGREYHLTDRAAKPA